MIEIDIHRYTPLGKLDKTIGITAQAADRIFNSHLPMVRTPFARYYRVTVVDPDRGTDLCPYIVRDTDHEIYGRQTMSPRSY